VKCRKKLEIAAEYASSHSKVEQERYKKYYNLRSADKHFQIGDQVLVLIPDTTASKLFSKWSGPGVVKAVRSPYSYEVDLNGVVRHYHANKLRKYHVHVESVVYDTNAYCFSNVDDNSLPVDEERGIAIDSCAIVYENDDNFGHIVPAPFHSSDVIERELPSTKVDPKSLEHLTP